jgi:hypothetical protein
MTLLFVLPAIGRTTGVHHGNQPLVEIGLSKYLHLPPPQTTDLLLLSSKDYRRESPHTMINLILKNVSESETGRSCDNSEISQVNPIVPAERRDFTVI